MMNLILAKCEELGGEGKRGGRIRKKSRLKKKKGAFEVRRGRGWGDFYSSAMGPLNTS